MGKGRHLSRGKEKSREQELSYKNKELQREVSRLKREIEKLKNIWNAPYEEPIESAPVEEAPKKKERICYSCGHGRLQMIKYFKPDGDWYYRECECGYRTRGKKLTEKVEE